MNFLERQGVADNQPTEFGCQPRFALHFTVRALSHLYNITKQENPAVAVLTFKVI